jgi:hypothetical protein
MVERSTHRSATVGVDHIAMGDDDTIEVPQEDLFDRRAGGCTIRSEQVLPRPGGKKQTSPPR